ncbi:MAG TPA: PQQ-binding-like beta-propeller repeat protein, partial [Nitrososphaerales archaeon]|nr:PQQ-binding-like beta-propeller repeat protein [Nitrososphaerales archaeon]
GQLTPVVFKGCKDGYIFALDASNGHMLWYLKPPAIAYENFAPLNPLNSTQMTKVDWAGYPKTGPVEMNPPETGSLESDLAYDPTTGTLFAAVYNSPKTFQLTDVGTGGAPFNQSAWEFDVGQNQFNIVTDSPINATIMAVDATTGGVEWSYLLQNLPYRGGLTVSGGVVYVATMDGVLRFLSESDGTLLGEKNIGGSLISQPSIGSDTDGTEMLFLSDMGSPRWEPAFPGFVQGLVLVRSPGPDAAQSAFLLAVGATAGAGVILVAMYLRQSWKSPTPARSPSSSARPRGPGRTSCAGSSSDRRHRIGGRNRLPLLL